MCNNNAWNKCTTKHKWEIEGFIGAQEKYIWTLFRFQLCWFSRTGFFFEWPTMTRRIENSYIQNVCTTVKSLSVCALKISIHFPAEFVEEAKENESSICIIDIIRSVSHCSKLWQNCSLAILLNQGCALWPSLCLSQEFHMKNTITNKVERWHLSPCCYKWDHLDANCTSTTPWSPGAYGTCCGDVRKILPVSNYLHIQENKSSTLLCLLSNSDKKNHLLKMLKKGYSRVCVKNILDEFISAISCLAYSRNCF